jgi:hypothetical protein
VILLHLLLPGVGMGGGEASVVVTPTAVIEFAGRFAHAQDVSVNFSHVLAQEIEFPLVQSESVKYSRH